MIDDPRQIPAADAPWRELEAFCALIAGPDGDARSIDELAGIARQVEVDMGAAGIDDLKVACYFWQRRLRWNDGNDGEAVRAIQGALDDLRRRGAAASEPGVGPRPGR